MIRNNVFVLRGQASTASASRWGSCLIRAVRDDEGLMYPIWGSIHGSGGPKTELGSPKLKLLTFGSRSVEQRRAQRWDLGMHRRTFVECLLHALVFWEPPWKLSVKATSKDTNHFGVHKPTFIKPGHIFGCLRGARSDVPCPVQLRGKLHGRTHSLYQQVQTQAHVRTRTSARTRARTRVCGHADPRTHEHGHGHTNQQPRKQHKKTDAATQTQNTHDTARHSAARPPARLHAHMRACTPHPPPPPTHTHTQIHTHIQRFQI